MKRITLINTVLRGFISAAILLTALFLTACDKNSSTDPGATLSDQTTPSADAAESVARAVGEDDGGVAWRNPANLKMSKRNTIQLTAFGQLPSFANAAIPMAFPTHSSVVFTPFNF